MIIDKDIRPEHQLYPIGAVILSKLTNSVEGVIDAFELYKQVKENHALSLNTFFLALDWLFVIGAVDEKNGMVVKCF